MAITAHFRRRGGHKQNSHHQKQKCKLHAALKKKKVERTFLRHFGASVALPGFTAAMNALRVNE
jgi:hypothetical protein